MLGTLLQPFFAGTRFVFLELMACVWSAKGSCGTAGERAESSAVVDDVFEVWRLSTSPRSAMLVYDRSKQ